MYYFFIKKIARIYVDILSIAAVMHEEDMRALKKIKDNAKKTADSHNN